MGGRCAGAIRAPVHHDQPAEALRGGDAGAPQGRRHGRQPRQQVLACLLVCVCHHEE